MIRSWSPSPSASSGSNMIIVTHTVQKQSSADFKHFNHKVQRHMAPNERWSKSVCEKERTHTHTHTHSDARTHTRTPLLRHGTLINRNLPSENRAETSADCFK
ncbi:Hypothetical predicted protein [Xyrichtys novacula]|uniref:Uncharacterized protein n=1 Tax=Xyrichtys novacula TaxID=13765 RepID=A0AAV1F497_XYRNO|nr:Hypothetical predicted protein [Xyrichtys novacula]